MDNADQHRSALPPACRQGHPWGPGQVSIDWTPCDCLAALTEPAHGHLIAHCRNPGCHETEQINVDALREVLEDWNLGAATDSRHSCMTALADSVSKLLAQAREHQFTLLGPSHLSPVHVASLGTWIQACVKAVHQAQESTPASHRDQISYMEKIKVRLATLADAFHIYASLLERAASADEATLGQTGRTHSLVELAEDEKVLLACRAATRRAIQQLISAVQVNC